MMWGSIRGPLLFTNEPEFTWGLIASLFLSNIFAPGCGNRRHSVPDSDIVRACKYMIPIITIVCVVGSYSSSYSMYGVLIMFLSGILGYLLVKNDYPRLPCFCPLCWLSCWSPICERHLSYRGEAWAFSLQDPLPAC